MITEELFTDADLETAEAELNQDDADEVLLTGRRSPKLLERRKTLVFALARGEQVTGEVESLLDAGDWSRRQLDGWVKTARLRLRSERELREVVPKMRQREAELKASMEAEEKDPKGVVVDNPRVMNVSGAKLAWHQQRNKVSNCEGSAINYLVKTASVEVVNASRAAESQAHAARVRLDENKKLLTLPQRIRRCKASIQQLRDATPPPVPGAEGMFELGRTDQLERKTEQLRRLRQEAGRYQRVAEAIEADRAAVKTAEKDLAAANEAVLDPLNMKF